MNRNLNDLNTKFDNLNEFLESKGQNFSLNEKIPTNYEKLKDLYVKLLMNHNELLKEKEEMVESLQSETLINEEQKNYIELLKQTLENKMGKLGSTIINQNQQYYKNKDVSAADILIDFVNIKNDSENYRKELIISQALINELREEIENLNSTKKEILSGQEKIFNNYDKSNFEIDNLKQRNKILEKEKIGLTEEITKSKSEQNILLDDLETLNKKFKKSEEENLSIIKKNSELSIKMNDYSYIQNKLNELKSNYEVNFKLVRNYLRNMKRSLEINLRLKFKIARILKI